MPTLCHVNNSRPLHSNGYSTVCEGPEQSTTLHSTCRCSCWVIITPLAARTELKGALKGRVCAGRCMHGPKHAVRRRGCGRGTCRWIPAVP